MSNLFIESLRNRVRAMNTLWERAADDMTLEQMNHRERPGVPPIALFHAALAFLRAGDTITCVGRA